MSPMSRRPHPTRAAFAAPATLAALAALSVLAACTDTPTPTGPARPGRPDLNLTPATTATYTTYDSRAALSAVATLGAPTTFEDVPVRPGDSFYDAPNPWTVGGVTYTTGDNDVFTPSSFIHPISNVLCYNRYSPMQGTFAPGDAYTAFGFDVGYVGPSSPMTLVIQTNVSSYTFPLGSVPSWQVGSTFAGIALTQPGEYLTGFAISAATGTDGGSAPCVDNVVVGHAVFPFAGFFQPVDNPTVVNLAKAGSSIPVKFSLGGDRGLAIFNSGYPKFVPEDCELGTTQDAIETTTANAGGLTYDPVSRQYTYVWKTDKAWAGKCGTLQLGLTDNSDHHADFKFTR